ncbi:hypothetical protein B0I37DRAFT_228686 [Chaetomium sp. MPI-CAGE-AT-0009]|nr:hypothetical protein B0I37DRAFT_228686 [Chaetomium sp. MPI-CAGE-AT-0009]
MPRRRCRGLWYLCSSPEQSGARSHMPASVLFGRGNLQVLGSSTLNNSLVRFLLADDLGVCWLAVGKKFRDPWRRAALGAIPNRSAGTPGALQACKPGSSSLRPASSGQLPNTGGSWWRCKELQIWFPSRDSHVECDLISLSNFRDQIPAMRAIDVLFLVMTRGLSGKVTRPGGSCVTIKLIGSCTPQPFKPGRAGLMFWWVRRECSRKWRTLPKPKHDE